MSQRAAKMFGIYTHMFFRVAMMTALIIVGMMLITLHTRTN